MMRNCKAGWGTLFSLGALFLAAGGAESKPADSTVAMINGKPILMSEFNRNVESVLEQYRKRAPAVLQQKGSENSIRQRVLNEMIDQELLTQEAQKREVKVRDRELDVGIQKVKERFKRDDSGKVLPDAETDALFQQELRKEGINYEQFRERIRKQLAVGRLVDESVRSRTTLPSKKEVKAYFDKIKKLLKGDKSILAGVKQEQIQDFQEVVKRFEELTAERIRPRHILIKISRGASLGERTKALKRIQEIKKRLDAGDEFYEMARQYSEDAESAARGGDLGSLIRGIMFPEFDKVAFDLPLGKVSDIVETPFGYHVIRVEERRVAQPLIYDEVKEDLTQYLYQQTVQEKLALLIKDLRSQATIDVHLPQGTP